MAAVKLQRVFIGLPVPRQAARQLFKTFTRHLNTSTRPVDWQNYHVTLAYLGAISQLQLAKLSQLMPALERHLPQTVNITSLAPFPNNPSRLLAAIIEPANALTALHRAVVSSARATGICLDHQQRFKPHITLLRAGKKPGEPLPTNDAFIQQFSVDTLGIYEGVTTGTGFRYQCLLRIPLSAGSSSG